MYGYLHPAFGLDLPVWQQYLNFWAPCNGDLGISVYLFPQPVTR
jgi:peptide/nickel transport system permease protein